MLHLSNKAKRYEPMISGFTAGTVIADITEFTNKQALSAGDIIELTQLPATTQLLDVDVYSTGGTGTVDVGFMSGEFGEKDNSRTCNDALIDGGPIALASAPDLTCLSLAKNKEHQAIGLTVSDAVAAGALNLKVVLRYAF